MPSHQRRQTTSPETTSNAPSSSNSLPTGSNQQAKEALEQPSAEEIVDKQEKDWTAITKRVVAFDGSQSQADGIADQVLAHIAKFYTKARGPRADYRKTMGEFIADKVSGDMIEFVRKWQRSLGGSAGGSQEWIDNGIELDVEGKVTPTRDGFTDYPSRVGAEISSSLVNAPEVRVYEGNSENRLMMQIERELGFLPVPARARFKVEVRPLEGILPVQILLIDNKTGQTVNQYYLSQSETSSTGGLEAWSRRVASSIGSSQRAAIKG